MVKCFSPIPLGVQTGCQITVTDNDAGIKTAPTGSVLFISSNKSDQLSSSSCVLAADASDPASSLCAAMYVTPDKPDGQHTITAAYLGDSTHKTNSGFAFLQVQRRVTDISIFCINPSVPFGIQSTCSVSAADNGNGKQTRPEGSVKFTSNQAGDQFINNVDSCQLIPSQQSPFGSLCEVTLMLNLPGGTHTVSAIYSPDQDAYHQGNGSSFPIQVYLRQTIPSIKCNLFPVLGTPVDCKITVTEAIEYPNEVPMVPTGTATLYSNGSKDAFSGNPCTLVPSASNASSCMVSITPASSDCCGDIDNSFPTCCGRNLGEKYSGDMAHYPAQSEFKYSYGLGTNGRKTTTTVACTPNPATPFSGKSSCTTTVQDVDVGQKAPPLGNVFICCFKGKDKFPSQLDPNFGDCALQPVGGDSSTCVIDVALDLNYVKDANSKEVSSRILIAQYNGKKSHFSSESSTVLQYPFKLLLVNWYDLLKFLQIKLSQAVEKPDYKPGDKIMLDFQLQDQSTGALITDAAVTADLFDLPPDSCNPCDLKPIRTLGAFTFDPRSGEYALEFATVDAAGNPLAPNRYLMLLSFDQGPVMPLFFTLH